MNSKPERQRKFKFFGIPLSLRCWLALVFFMSWISHMDLITNSMFYGKMWRTFDCSIHNNTTEHVWRQVLEQSWLNVWLPYLPLFTFAEGAWLAMYFQILFAFLHVMPLSLLCFFREHGYPQDWHWRLEENAHHQARPYKYDAPLHIGQGHRREGQQTLGDAWQVLAELNRMASPLFQHWTCCKISKAGTRCDSWLQKMKRSFTFVLSFLILECGSQMWVQSSALAVAFAVTEEVNYLMAISLAFSLINLAINLFLHSGRVLDTYLIIQQEAVADLDDKPPNVIARDQAALGPSKHWLKAFSILAIACVFLFFYVATIVYNAVWGCPQGVWSLRNGCLHVNVH